MKPLTNQRSQLGLVRVSILIQGFQHSVLGFLQDETHLGRISSRVKIPGGGPCRCVRCSVAAVLAGQLLLQLEFRLFKHGLPCFSWHGSLVRTAECLFYSREVFLDFFFRCSLDLRSQRERLEPLMKMAEILRRLDRAPGLSPTGARLINTRFVYLRVYINRTRAKGGYPLLFREYFLL